MIFSGSGNYFNAQCGVASRRDTINPEATSFCTRRVPSKWFEIFSRGKFENEHENPANFQNSASYRFGFPWALLWDGPLYSSASTRASEQDGMSVGGSGTGLQREVLSVAKLPSTSFTSSRQPSPACFVATVSSYDHSPLLCARYYFYKYTSYHIPWSNSQEREKERERNAPRGKFDRIGPLIPVSKKRARWLSLFSHSSEILPTILRLSLLFVFLYMVFLSSATLAARSLRLLFDLRVSSRK